MKIKRSKKWYSYENIDSTNALYRMVMGERSNGKTYGAMKKQLKTMLIRAKICPYS